MLPMARFPESVVAPAERVPETASEEESVAAPVTPKVPPTVALLVTERPVPTALAVRAPSERRVE